MKRVFCMITIFMFLMTIQSYVRSDNRIPNENGKTEFVYYYNYKVWKVTRSGSDAEDEGKLSTYTSAFAFQQSSSHSLHAYASFSSSYEDPKDRGTWYLRARLKHDFATDEEPYRDEGRIDGKSGGMNESGDQSDTDWFADYDPILTISGCDAYADARVFPKNRFMKRSESYVPNFAPATWIHEKP